MPKHKGMNMNTDHKKKVLISGAGIAGLTLAYWLNKDGHSVTIVEKSAESRQGGYKVDVRGAALTVTERMGINPALESKNVNIQRSQFITHDEKVHTFEEDILGHSSEGDIEVNRWDLCQIISEGIDDVTRLSGDSITSINDETGEVQFEKSPAQQFDIIVGADGTYSNVRNIVFGDHADFLLKSGIQFCVFPTENVLDLDDAEVVYLQKGKMVAAYSVKGNSFVCFAFKGEEERVASEARKNVFSDQFKESGWKSSQLVELMMNSDECYFGSIDQVRMPTSWHKGRTVLVGDAAHAAHGIATSLAIVGGYVLAREIKKHDDINVAFEAYQSALWDFVKNAQDMSESNTDILSQADSPFFKFQLLLIKKIPAFFLTWMTKKGKEKMKALANDIEL